MNKSKKWSEQILIEESFKTQTENGKEVIHKGNILQVCLGGKDLYRKNFVEGKYKGKNKLVVPFDFILLAGDMCPEGKFYEMEYFIGENGMVYRALIQAVNPCIDLPQMLGALKHRNILPDGFNPQKAWLRSDIDAVSIGNCTKDEDGEPIFFCGHKAAKDSDINVAEYTAQYKSACLEYYRGDVREVWTEPGRCFRAVFVCGSDNVNDPAFAAQREADLEEMKEHFNDAICIANDYNICHFVTYDCGKDAESGKNSFIVAAAEMPRRKMNSLLDAVYTHKDAEDTELNFIPDVEALVDKCYSILANNDGWDTMTLHQRMNQTYDEIIKVVKELKDKFAITDNIRNSYGN